ncbi:F14D16.5 [Arabidopsis thaliana]|uniref:F14D16.5 n=1 Tax=Arabidopsis thaliana TaxID=3702 RepID=Q9LMD7_ARATH|nr:F14D16.5 [Arabidopsis thaliana]
MDAHYKAHHLSPSSRCF